MEVDILTREELNSMSLPDLMAKSTQLQVVDNGFQDRGDLEERIVLTLRKLVGDSLNPFDNFEDDRVEDKEKCKTLYSILKKLYNIFSTISTEPLSEVLVSEKLLKHPDLKDELKVRIKALEEREPLVIIAGETNGGKSTFLNVLLGKQILPSYVGHCTFAICKIKYSKTYSIQTVDHEGEVEFYPCDGWESARDKLKTLVGEEKTIKRLEGSNYREITLKMPASVLQSGVTLVDTPGIGETEEIDDITMSYIRNTRAAGFVYIIKSDQAGGLQEDRLIKFLQAIQNDYKTSSVEGAVDPKAAVFICNRWDVISKEGAEKVKKNAQVELDTVWPGFENDQLYFFSSKKTQLHLDADPQFVTDKLNDVMLGLRKLFQRASHNYIQYHYWWTKYFVQLASSHLRSMFKHASRSQEEQTSLFGSVAATQEKLKNDSDKKSQLLQNDLKGYKETLIDEVYSILSEVRSENLEDYQELVSICSTDTFLNERSNTDSMNQWIRASLIHYCSKRMQESRIMERIEADAKDKINGHMGLFEDKLQQISEFFKGSSSRKHHDCNRSSEVLGTSLKYLTSSFCCGFDGYDPTLDWKQIDQLICHFDQKNKKSGLFKLLPKFKEHVLSLIKPGKMTATGDQPSDYLDNQIQENARMLRETPEIVAVLAEGYLELIERFMNSVMKKIPHFIEVNEHLMESIRKNHKALRDEKDEIKEAMRQLEPCREQLRGYALLYKEDVNADLVDLNIHKRHSNLKLDPRTINCSCRPNDSGFSGSGSTLSKVMGFWNTLKVGQIRIDDEPEEVLLKIYTFEMDKTFQLSEIASLRCLEHENLAPFFGMTRIAKTNNNANDVAHKKSRRLNSIERVSAFIFKGSLISARLYKRNRSVVMKEFVKIFTQGLLSGLEFIHQEKFVHLELNLDTVMVNVETGVVQLCQQCMPRAIDLPSDLTIPTNLCVCLSPAVLEGAAYGIVDDIYALGLLLWELYFPHNLPYAEQKQWPLERFIKEVNPKRMLGPEIENLEAYPTILHILREIFISGKGYSMTAADIQKCLQEDCLPKPKISQRGNYIRKINRGDSVPIDARLGPSIKLDQDDVDNTPKRPPRKKDALRFARNDELFKRLSSPCPVAHSLIEKEKKARAGSEGSAQSLALSGSMLDLVGITYNEDERNKLQDHTAKSKGVHSLIANILS